MVRCTDHSPRHWLGIAKKESSHFCKQSGHGPVGGIWAHGCKCLPITDRRHYHNTRGYIHDHIKKGAVIWERTQVSGMESFDPDSLLIS